ncbi:aspartyl-phosphate phosphatase Spo0E family protein [Paenibacillus piri]|uniref:Aspartyl-phosphate phosphatase Spo0E family protein n=1 Tax=Paenibacillus piri TaxID=2547395 RepID=A0A4R5KGG7_9BACL|nr:aspartyl-phosphate phosphatase Spo0E family protein [Paenibacillus piri]
MIESSKLVFQGGIVTVCIEDKIELLRTKLITMVEHTGNLIDAGVISLSQELDEVLIEFEKRRQPRSGVA